jgi:hypothetical protein
MTPQELAVNLSDQSWRMNNLYNIIDKDGNRQPFRWNWAQREMHENIHYLNIILKARQLGMSTDIQIYLLDVALFYPDTSCGVIAQTLDDATGLFSSKIMFAYNNLPEAVKKLVYPVKQNTTELYLSNGSSIRVGTSLRGGTYQFLHISEFGKISARFPDRAREIVTGALNTLAPGSFAFIESTAEGQDGRFYDMVQRSRSMADQGKRLTEMDWKFHFFPWFKEPKYSIDPEEVIISPILSKYFDLLELEHDIKLTDGQRAWYAKKHEDQQDDMMREFPSTPDEAFAAAIEGAYYGEIITRIEKNGQITRVPYDEMLGVETAWDLGYKDSTSIWFYQRERGGAIRLIDYYENSGEGLAHYCKVLRNKPYRYVQHCLPHDVRVTEIGSGKTRKEQLEQLGLTNLVIAPDLSVMDGIEAVRNTLPKCYFDEVKCADGVKALRNYRKDWNDKLGTWANKPLHDWSSHCSDAFRYLAIAPEHSGANGFDTPTHKLNLPRFGNA